MPGEIKHYWVGTTLMVESDAGVSGCDLKGQTGDTGPRGPQGPAGIVDIADNIDGTTLIKNENGIISTAIGGGMAECLAKGIGLNKKSVYMGCAGGVDIDVDFELGEVYSFYFVFTTGETDTFTITMPTEPDPGNTEGVATVILTDSKYFKNCHVSLPSIDDSGRKIYFIMPRYKDTITETMYVKDVYITAGNNGMFMPITPYVIPIDGTTIQVNANGKLTAVVSGGGGDYTPTTETWTFTLEDGTTVNKVVCVG